MIKRHDLIVLVLSVLIAASFWIFPLAKNVYSYKIFQTAGGYGYDILVNDSIKIHQDVMPVLKKRKSFAEEQQARQVAMLVIEKLRAGKNPAISRAELETIIVANE